MAINISAQDFYDSLTEIVGYKSGLVLDLNDVRRLEDENLDQRWLTAAIKEGRKRDDCVSAWNKDPVFGVIGVQSGPPH